VRRCFALLLAAAFAAAQDDAELERAVEELIRELGSPVTGARQLARARLAAYGERIRPLLARVSSDDPEVRRALRGLVRSSDRVELELVPPGPQRIGAPLVLHVRIVNNTDQTHALLPPPARQGDYGPFYVRVGEKELTRIHKDLIAWDKGGELGPLIRPGETLDVTLRMGDGRSPLTRPAITGIVVGFDGTARRGYGELSNEESDGEDFNLVLESAAVEVHVLGRRPEELEKALRSDDAKERENAIAELSLRDDEAIIPALRRLARERPVRLAAVRRLGALGAAQDFDLILAATRDEDADVRRAAVLGLAKHPTPTARRRLTALAQDHELQAEAIRALRGHKHPATIDVYLQLLRLSSCPRESVRQIQAALFDWTGLAVDDRPSEIKAFQAWWEANRGPWAAANATDR
jgi:hypothetical protein